MNKPTLVLTFLFAFLMPVAFANTVITASASAPVYGPGDLIIVQGYAYSGTNISTNQNVALAISNATGTVNSSSGSPTDSDGFFNASILAPTGTGDYNVTITVGDGSAIFPISISDASETRMFFVNSTEGYMTALLSSPCAYDYNATEITGDVTCGSFDYDSKTYYVLAQKPNATYDTLFVDDDNIFNFTAAETDSSVQKYLVENTGVDLGTAGATVAYIDPYGGEADFVRTISPSFLGSDGDTATLVAIVLNSTGGPISQTRNTTFYFRNSTGQLEGVGTAYNSTGATSGLVALSFDVSTTGGVHFIQSGRSQISYKVNKFLLRPTIRDSEGNDISFTSPGSALTLVASVITQSTQTPISTANASVRINGPNGNYTLLDLAYNSTTQIYEASYNVPSQVGVYKAEFSATYNGSASAGAIPFEVSSFDMIVKPISKGKDGAGQGFPVNEPGMILVGARNLSNGAFVNMTSATNNCDPAYLQLLGMYDAAGTDKIGNLTTMISWLGQTYSTPISNFSTFISQMSEGSEVMEPEILEAFESIAGAGACAIVFAAPSTAGVYTAKVNTTIAGVNKITMETVRVQSFFVDAFPMSSRGGFQPTFSPGQRVYLGVNAYDPQSGSPIAASNITDVQLVEVVTESGVTVTSKMLSVLSNGTTAGFRTISFVANDSIMGQHFVRLKIKADINGTVQEALGEGFFNEQLYRTWAQPVSNNGDMKMAFGGTDNITLKVQVRDSSGVTGQSGITVSLSSVTNMNTFQNVNTTTSQSCTTISDGTCQLSVNNTVPWKSGGYNVRIKIKDSNNNTDYGYGWFQVSNFMFWAYTENFETSTTENITFNLSASYSNNTALNGTAVIDKVMYFGSMDSWSSPTVANGSINAEGTITDGQGSIVLPAGSVRQSGQYAAVITATANGMTETAQAWFMSKPFTLFAQPADGNNWENSYGVDVTVTYTVTGFDSTNWATWPPTGVGHNLSSAYVASIEKSGFWGQSYKKRSDLQTQNAMTSTCAANQCNLSFNTTGFAQGEYMVRIAANDSQGAKGEYYTNVRIKVLSINIPGMLQGSDGVMISKEYPSTNATSITLTGSCGSSDANIDTPLEPANVTNCKFDAVRMVNKSYVKLADGGTFVNPYNYTCLLLDKGNRRLYVANNNVNCTMWENGTVENANFTVVPMALNITQNDTFLDASGNNWTVTSIDFDNNKVYFQSTLGVIMTLPNYPVDGNQNNLQNLTYYAKINQSLSKSGTFYYSKNNNEMLRDSDWDRVDLNGNGNYNQDWYPLVLADPTVAGRYDTLITSNVLDDFLSATANVTVAGPNTVDAINYTKNATTQTYLLSIKFATSTAGASVFKIYLASNNPGWGGGQSLGRFKPDSIIKVPVIITSPSNRSQIKNNMPVRVSAISKQGGMNTGTGSSSNLVAMNSTNCLGNKNVTGMCAYGPSSSGLAIIPINASTLGVDTGQYRFVVEACDMTIDEDCSSEEAWIGMSTDWENPQVELRNFEVSGQFGKAGAINSLISISQAAETMTELISEDIPLNGTVYGQRGWCQQWNAIECARPMVWGPGGNAFRNLVIFENDTWVIDSNNDGNYGGELAINISNATTGVMTVPLVGERNIRIMLNISGYDYPSFNYTLAWPYIVEDYQNLSSDWDKIVHVANGTEGWNLLLTNTIGRQTQEDSWGGSWGPFDSAYLVSSINATIYNDNISQNNLSIGTVLPLLNKAVIKAQKWESSVVLTNVTFGGVAPRGIQSCDAPIYYVANFTEQSAGVSMSTNGNSMFESLGNRTYYALFFDQRCDGANQMTTAMIVPDEPDFSQNSGNDQNNQKFWIEIGSEYGWPVRINRIDTSNESNIRANLFRQNYGPFASNETLSMLVTARYFDGLPVNGNVSVQEIIGYDYSSNMGEDKMGGGGSKDGGNMMMSDPVEVVQNVSGFATISNGEGFLNLNISNLTGSYYNAKFVVYESLGGAKEIITNDIPTMSGMNSGGPCIGSCGDMGGQGGQGGNGSSIDLSIRDIDRNATDYWMEVCNLGGNIDGAFAVNMTFDVTGAPSNNTEVGTFEPVFSAGSCKNMTVACSEIQGQGPPCAGAPVNVTVHGYADAFHNLNEANTENNAGWAFIPQ